MQYIPQPFPFQTMGKKRRKSTTTPRPPQPKKRRTTEVLAEAQESHVKLRADKFQRFLKVEYELKPEFLRDPNTIAAIVDCAKRQEIAGTRYTSYLQPCDLLEPIAEFPRKVTNPVIRIIGDDKYYGPSQHIAENQRRHWGHQRKDVHEREIRKLQHLIADEILDVFRLYVPNKAFHDYCYNVLKTTPKEEAMRYRLPNSIKVFASQVLEDAKMLRVTLSVFHPLNTLNGPKDPAQLQLDNDLRGKLVAKHKDLRHKLIEKRVSQASDLREILNDRKTQRESGFWITLTGENRIVEPHGPQFINPAEPAIVPDGATTRISSESYKTLIITDSDVFMGPPSVSCSEQSLGIVHAQDIVGPLQSNSQPPAIAFSFQTQAPTEVHGKVLPMTGEQGNAETPPCPEQSFGSAHAQVEDVDPAPTMLQTTVPQDVCPTRDKFGPLLGKFEMDPNEPWAEPSNFNKNCPRSYPQKLFNL